MEKINQGGFYYMSDTPIANGNYIAFDIAAQYHSDCYLYSIDDNVMKRNDEDEKIGMPFPLCIALYMNQNQDSAYEKAKAQELLIFDLNGNLD